MSESPRVDLPATEAIRLVAGRELRTRLRSKAYRVTTAVLVLVVVLFAVVMELISGHGSTRHVGFTDAAAALRPQVTAAAKALDQHITTVRVTDPQTGRRLVRDGKLDALVVGVRGSQLDVVVDKNLDPKLQTTLSSAASQATLASEITRLGGSPATVAAQVARSGVSVTPLQPSPRYDPQRLVLGSVAGILIYLALIGTGMGVAQGVVEEKSSRVVELLLATIRPWQLMAGKVLGIGLVGLLQVTVVGVAGVVAGELTGALTISVSATAGAVAWLVIWFVLGFTLYALLFAGLGALVSRQEDLAGTVAPATMLLVLGYVVGISVLPTSPDQPLVAAMSLIPAFAPTLMPMRLAIGGVPWWQTAVALVLTVGFVPLLVGLTGRLYRNGVVRTGARVRLRDALRAD
ncbi:MAG TPA: ABC transporter permease [Marmoricola sp.]|nr:ABC transporter permease [Marmoricola sp.]